MATSIDNLEEEQACKFCCKEPPKYTCPRCNVSYCSKDCYNSPGHAYCSEDFYKEMIDAELKSGNVSNENKQKMIDILHRMNDDQDKPEELDSDDDDEEIDLADRIKDIDLDDTDTLWGKLTKSEQEEFQKILKCGNISDIMPTWTPWWIKKYPDKPLVEDPNVPYSAPYQKLCPNVIKVSNLSQLTKVKPSACIPLNILNVLSAYAWTVRIFNGDYSDNIVEVTESLLQLSTVLASGANYEVATMAVDSVNFAAQNISWLAEDAAFANTVKSDVQALIEGPNKSESNYYVLSALSDIIYILKSTKTCLGKRKNPKKKGNFSKTFIGTDQNIDPNLTTVPLIKNIIKKIEYYISFMMENNIIQ